MTILNKNLKENTLGVVLAGGKSSRLGQDKTFLLLGNEPLWQKAVNTLSPLVSEVVISHNSPSLFKSKHQVISDLIRDKGPLGGIYSVMKCLPRKFYLFLPVDLPLVSSEVLAIILNSPEEFDVVIPRIKGRLEPLLARYKATCRSQIEARLAQNDLKVTGFFDNMKVKLVTDEAFTKTDPKLLSFLNVNTPADLIRLERRIS